MKSLLTILLLVITIFALENKEYNSDYYNIITLDTVQIHINTISKDTVKKDSELPILDTIDTTKVEEIPIPKAPKEKVEKIVIDSSTNKSRKPVRFGLGFVVGNQGYGLSSRFWILDKLGISLNVKQNWLGDIQYGEVQANLKINLNTVTKPYLLIGGGIQNVDILDHTPPLHNEISGILTLGVGAEAILGKRERHGISMEVSYINGSLNYTTMTKTNIGDETQTVGLKTITAPPISVKALYHFYF